MCIAKFFVTQHRTQYILRTLEDHISTSKGPFLPILASLESGEKGLFNEGTIVNREALRVDIWSPKRFAWLQTIVLQLMLSFSIRMHFWRFKNLSKTDDDHFQKVFESSKLDTNRKRFRGCRYCWHWSYVVVHKHCQQESSTFERFLNRQKQLRIDNVMNTNTNWGRFSLCAKKFQLFEKLTFLNNNKKRLPVLKQLKSRACNRFLNAHDKATFAIFTVDL